MSFQSIDLTAILITMTLFVMTAVIVVVLLFVHLKKRQMEIEAYKQAIEKGLPVPELKAPKSPYGTLKAALVWMAIGIGFFIMMLVDGDRTAMAVASIPALIGIALAISFAIEKKAAREEKLMQE